MSWLTHTAGHLTRFTLFSIVMQLAIISGLFVSWSLFHFIGIVDQGVQSQQVVSAAEAIKYTLVDAETGQRGYIITGDEVFLQPYNYSKAIIEIQLLDFTDKARLNGSVYATELIDLAHARLDELDSSIQLRRDSGFDVARDKIKTYFGKLAMDDVRLKVQDIARSEELRIVSYNHEIKYTARMVIYAATLLFGCLIYLILFRPPETNMTYLSKKEG